MRRTRVKICGITRPRDAAAAAEAGADAIGLVLHASSRRLVSLEEARNIVAVLPPFVSTVGLFVDAKPPEILTLASALSLSAIQLHGHEAPDAIDVLQPLPVIKALFVDPATLGQELRRWRAARPAHLVGLVMDPVGGGGAGIANDWGTLHRHLAAGDFADLPPLIAAGGLTPGTVGDVIRLLRPWAVDVSSGVESGPGEKSPELIRRFIEAVHEADADSPAGE